MLTKTKPARERILLIGSFGAGKSNAWCTIAAWLRRTKSPAKVYVIDTDHAADRLSEGYEDFYNNVVAENVWDYNEVLGGLRRFHKAKPTKEDWLVVDLADKLWKMSQEHYIDEAFGKDAASFFLEYKKGGGAGHALSGEYGTNWQIVNQLYNTLMTLCQRWPGHVMFCTPADPVERPDAKTGKGGDDKETVAMYGKFSVKPAGQKALGFQFFTVIWMIPKGNESWAMTSIKDLNRDRPQNQPIKDFVMDYLVKIGGWTLESS